MATGSIVKWFPEKGFGFIKQAGGPDLFFHLRDCLGFEPAVHAKIDFTIGEGNGGKPAAKQVKLVGGVPVAAQAQAQRAPPINPAAGPGTAGDLLLPDPASRLAAARLGQPGAVHPGLLLDRLPTRQHLTDQEHQKEHLDRVTKARPWGKDSYQALLKHLEQGIPSFLCTARSRIALHLSRAGGLENANCCLHPIHGFAYLPGSGLKGLAAAYAGHLWESQVRGKPEEEAFVREVEDIFGWAPNQIRNAETPREADPRSARAKKREVDQMRGGVIFHDAFGLNEKDEPPQLDVDVLTCHYPDYYTGDKPPGDWQSPRPVTFLTIAAGTRFRFRVSAASCDVAAEQVEAAKRLLLGGLYWLGAGAKTAAGYGAFDPEISEDEETRSARRLAKQQQQARQALEALARLWPLPEGKALWVPKQVGSSKGYRICRQPDSTWTWEDGWEFGKNPQPKAVDSVFVADLNPQVAKRLGNPQLQEGVHPPDGRPK